MLSGVDVRGDLSVLVTGGAGFIGSHLVDRLLAEGIGVTVLDNLQGGFFENIRHNVGRSDFHFVEGDIRDVGLIQNLVKGVDAVFHYAALVSVPDSIRDPLLTNDVNVNGTLNLLKACVAAKVHRFVFASSSAVYGEAETLPLKEDCPLAPISPYGVSKLAAEKYVTVFNKVFGLGTVCFRFFNVYGPRQSDGCYSGVITRFMSRIASDTTPEIFGDGEQSRDFVHVQDVIEANMLALKKEMAGAVFNIGGGEATTINQLAQTMLKIAKKPHLKLVHSKPREGDIRHSVADISKARKQLCYNPKISLKEGLEELTKNHGIQK